MNEEKENAMFKKILPVFILIAVLHVSSGCAGMPDTTSKLSGLGVVTQEKSTFDGAIIIEVSPNWLYDPADSWGNSVKLGAHWSSNVPEYVALVLSYSSNTSGYGSTYVGLSNIDINIEGEIKSYSTGKPTNFDISGYNSVTQTIYTESKNTVIIPYSTLERMVNANDCRLRIHTTIGYEDARFSMERIQGGKGTAILSIREFIEKVDAIKTES